MHFNWWEFLWFNLMYKGYCHCELSFQSPYALGMTSCRCKNMCMLRWWRINLGGHNCLRIHLYTTICMIYETHRVQFKVRYQPLYALIVYLSCKIKHHLMTKNNKTSFNSYIGTGAMINWKVVKLSWLILTYSHISSQHFTFCNFSLKIDCDHLLKLFAR